MLGDLPHLDFPYLELLGGSWLKKTLYIFPRLFKFSVLKCWRSKIARHLCQLEVTAVKPPCSNYFLLKQSANRKIPTFSSWNAAHRIFLTPFQSNEKEKGEAASSLKIKRQINRFFGLILWCFPLLCIFGSHCRISRWASTDSWWLRSPQRIEGLWKILI